MARDPFGDRRAQTEGLELLVGAARGAMFDVIGKPEGLFERLEASCPLLPARRGIRPEGPRRRTHPIRVDVPRRGASSLAAAADQHAGRPARQPLAARTVIAALTSPLMRRRCAARCVVRAAGPEAGKVRCSSTPTSAPTIRRRR